MDGAVWGRAGDAFWSAVAVFNGFVLAYFFILNGLYLLHFILGFLNLRREARRLKALPVEDLVDPRGALPCTVIIPVHNEETHCDEVLRALLALRYPDFKILVVNDGSKDATFSKLSKIFSLVPAARMATAEIPTSRILGVYRSRVHANLWVIDKENGGKSDALNAGINHCDTPLFCAIDGDTLLERDALTRLVRPFLEDADTIAVGGNVRIVNGCVVESGIVREVRMPRKWIEKLQVMEYLRAFLGGRVGWQALDCTLLISGAFGLFQRAAVVAAGGYSRNTLGEDMELILRLHRLHRTAGHRYRIVYVSDPVAWTECPADLRTLGRQRDRWQRGLMVTLAHHTRMMFNPRFGRAGLLGYPYFFFLEMLGPAIEFGGYITFAAAVAFGQVDMLFIAAYLMAAIVFGIVLSVGAVALHEMASHRYPRMGDIFQLYGLAVLENLGYRQLSLYWRLHGIFSWMRGDQSWGRMTRNMFVPGRA